MSASPVLFWTYSDDLIPEEIRKYYLKVYKKLPSAVPLVGNKLVGEKEDKNVRDVKMAQIATHTGIPAMLFSAMINANRQSFKFDIEGPESSNFLSYKKNQQYVTHPDEVFLCPPIPRRVRKLSAFVSLNDNYKGGRFYIHGHDGEKFYPELKAGQIIVFPSLYPHGVEPVTKGTRYSVVLWGEGPAFK